MDGRRDRGLRLGLGHGDGDIGGQALSGGADVDFDVATLRLEGRVRHEISPRWLVGPFLGLGFDF